MLHMSKVYLVGAGPGDPELLTVKALRLLQNADVLVYDRLISDAILELVPSGVTKIFVGKANGHHSLPQAEINDLLVALARNNRRIVRLKGGDPFVFGRGSEEALHLRRHGIAFEVVPGVTSAAACATYAGVPLTHRGLARGVHLITGHFRDNEPLDFDARALADPDATLVVYMGLANLPGISRRLIAAGLPASTPAMAVQNGTTPAQQRVLSDLRSLPAKVQAAGLEPPVLVVIGRTVSLSAELDWFSPQREQEDVTLDAGVGI
ncbi:MAG: uroporphyrinogen-III C-methyltransferase [Thiogranum sp.]|jgi:uroporphyrin-III C-methyltransferase/precorrin-2 dehydrogenase/sirohydrochlorin ferrochelatase/uroporphyrin-III C-methyltransferase|nr:uroporphyrinogen-III C-methyltransferase [Thiogranum sp.]